jgi:hypothetical protein
VTIEDKFSLDAYEKRARFILGKPQKGKNNLSLEIFGEVSAVLLETCGM